MMAKGPENSKAETMEFITEKRDYNVAELDINFKSRFPVLVQVKEGFYGVNEGDTFDKGEVLLIVGISQQTRVVARMNMHEHCRVFSIPATFPEHLCAVRRGKKHLNPTSLSDLLATHDLPLTVQFPPDYTLTFRNRSMNTNHIPAIEILNTFEETYLLGNLVADGQMYDDVIHVPLYMSQLRFSLVTGIKRMSDTEWHEFHKHLLNQSSRIAYDLHVGKEYIGEYDSDISDTVFNTQLTYIKPVIHENIIDILETVPDVQLRKRPKFNRNTPSLMSTSGRKSVYSLIQEWTKKITSKIKTNNGSHHHRPQSSAVSETDARLEPDDQSEDKDKLFPNSKKGNYVSNIVKELKNSEERDTASNFKKSTGSPKNAAAQDDVPRLAKPYTDSYVKPFKFQKHKLERKLPEESEEEDTDHSVKKHEIDKEVLKDKNGQTKYLAKSHGSKAVSDSSYTRPDEGKTIHSHVQKFVGTEQTQKEKLTVNNARIEEWLEKNSHYKHTTPPKLPLQPKSVLHTKYPIGETVPTRPMSPKVLLKYTRQLSDPSSSSLSNNYKMDTHLPKPMSPKLLAAHNLKIANRSPTLSPKTLAKFYTHSSEHSLSVPSKSVINNPEKGAGHLHQSSSISQTQTTAAHAPSPLSVPQQ